MLDLDPDELNFLKLYSIKEPSFDVWCHISSIVRTTEEIWATTGKRTWVTDGTLSVIVKLYISFQSIPTKLSPKYKHRLGDKPQITRMKYKPREFVEWYSNQNSIHISFLARSVVVPDAEIRWAKVLMRGERTQSYSRAPVRPFLTLRDLIKEEISAGDWLPFTLIRYATRPATCGVAYEGRWVFKWETRWTRRIVAPWRFLR